MWYVPVFLLYKLLLYFVFSAACDLVWFYVSAAGDLMSSHKLRVYSFHQISKFLQLLRLQIIFIHPFLSILQGQDSNYNYSRPLDILSHVLVLSLFSIFSPWFILFSFYGYLFKPTNACACVCTRCLMPLSANSIISVISENVSINRVFSQLWVSFSCLFA